MSDSTLPSGSLAYRGVLLDRPSGALRAAPSETVRCPSLRVSSPSPDRCCAKSQLGSLISFPWSRLACCVAREGAGAGSCGIVATARRGVTLDRSEHGGGSEAQRPTTPLWITARAWNRRLLNNGKRTQGATLRGLRQGDLPSNGMSRYAGRIEARLAEHALRMFRRACPPAPETPNNDSP